MSDIYGLMAGVMKKMVPIGKDRVNQQQGFNFRGIEDLYNYVQPILSDAGIFMTPEVVAEEREERVNQKGTTLAFSRITMKYTFWASDGSSVFCTVMGEGMDSGDKSSNKAMSIAHKYALLQCFAIPTKGLDDPDAESHQVQPKQQQAAAQPKADNKAIVEGVFSRVTNQEMLDKAIGWCADKGYDSPWVNDLIEVTRGRISFIGDMPKAEPKDDGPPSSGLLGQTHGAFKSRSREERLGDASCILGREVTTFKGLSASECHKLLDYVKSKQEEAA